MYSRFGSVWSVQGKLLAPDRSPDDLFGSAAVIYNADAFIGSKWDNVSPSGIQMGSVYHYKRSGNMWSVQSKIIAPDGINHDYFGSSVALYDTCALIGAPGKNGRSTDSGIAR